MEPGTACPLSPELPAGFQNPDFRTQALVLRAPVGIRSLLNEPKGGVSLEKLEFLERGVYIFFVVLESHSVSFLGE